MKTYFSGNKTLEQCLGANSKNTFLLKFYSNFLLFLVFSAFSRATLKKQISANVWSAQHPKAGQNTHLREHPNFSNQTIG